MNWIVLGVFLACSHLVIADVSEISKKSAPPTKLDPVLRKALLKALSNLDKDSETGEDVDSTTVEATTAGEDLEESTKNERPLIRVSSFLIDASNQTFHSDSGEEIIKTIIIKKPRTTLTPPLKQVKAGNFLNLDPVRDPENDIEIDSVQVARSVATSVTANEVSSEERTTTTTAAPTTTTPEPPTTDEIGQNIENVKPEDVKIYSAPLVAAFSVQQDEQGNPKQVISLFKQLNAQNEVKPAKPVMAFKNEPIAVATTVRPTTESPIITRPDTSTIFFTTQRNDNNDPFLALEQKNRQLEEQITFLRQQQRQHQELLRQQQALDQQNFQRQQQLFFDQQRQLRTQNQNFEQVLSQNFEQTSSQRFDQARNSQNFDNSRAQPAQNFEQLRSQSQPANSQNVQLVQSVALPPRQINEITDFRGQNFFPNRFPNFNSFPQFQPLSNQVSIQKSKEQETRSEAFTLQPPSLKAVSVFQNFNTPPNPSLNLIKPALSESQSLNKNRVFRNDATQTGNFGFNNNNQVQIQQSIPLNFPQPNGEQNIQNLLLRSGVQFSPKSAEEDFNIISKVLALNHGIQPSQTNNLGLGFNERRFR